MTVRKFYDEERLKAIATEVCSQPLTTSYYRTGKEEKRLPTKEETKIIYSLVYSALHTICHHSHDEQMEQIVCDNTEMTFDVLTNWEYNGYISIYCKLRDILEHWETEEY